MSEERESGHKHDHGHNHRESFRLPHGEAFLEAHVHDQASTVSMAICPDEGALVAFADLTAALQDIASRVEGVGGVIGHIKAFARQEDGFAHASIVDAHAGVSCEGDDSFPFGADADIQLVAIALLVSQDELVTFCKQAISQTLGDSD